MEWKENTEQCYKVMEEVGGGGVVGTKTNGRSNDNKQIVKSK